MEEVKLFVMFLVASIITNLVIGRIRSRRH